MQLVIKFLAGLEIPIYLMLGVVAVVYLRRLVVALDERRSAVFGLEREAARRKVSSSISVLVLIGLLTVGEFIVATFLVGEIMQQPSYATPTLQFTKTSLPTSTGPVPTDATHTPTLYPQATVTGINSQCVAGVLEMTAPKQDDTVSGVVEILGSVDTPSFGSYYYAYSNTGETLNWQTIAAGSEVTKEGSLGFWYTANLVPGDYYLILVALDNDGKEQSNCIIRVYVEPEG